MNKKKQKRRITGDIVSDKMSKTVVVEIQRSRMHPLYQKRYRIKKRILAHDPEDKFKTGQKVLIEETRPLSRKKSYRVIKKIKDI